MVIKTMKKIVTTLWCAALAIAGYFITSSAPEDTVSNNAVYAATLPSWNNNGQLPLDLVLEQTKKINKVDTVEVHDTVVVDNTKYVRVPVPGNTTDTLYMPLYVPNHVDGVSVNAVNTDHGKKSTVILTVDGQIVYTTDGLKKP